MGRKTWESLPRKPLPGRQNIVITRQDYQAEGAQTAASLEDALALCQGAEEVIIMGGAQIYAQALPIATDLRLTESVWMWTVMRFFLSFPQKHGKKPLGKTMFPPKASNTRLCIM